MSSISRLTSSVSPATSFTATARPPLDPPYRSPYGLGVDPRYRAIGSDGDLSIYRIYQRERLGTGRLPDLDALTRWRARWDHFISGPAFPEYQDGLFRGRLIEGTDLADRIEVRYEPSTGGAYITRYAPGDASGADSKPVTTYLNAEEARFLKIDGMDGDDRILVDPRFPYSVYLRGGSGHDFLVGGAGNDILEGGTGKDIVVGNSGLDRAFFDDPGDQEYLGTDQPMEP